jgi:TP901 family phage tail tape measure protein
MANTRVIQGTADLDIQPFLTKLTQLEAAVNASVANIGIAMQRMAASATAGVNGMQASTVAMGQSAAQAGQQANAAAAAATRTGQSAASALRTASMAAAGISGTLRDAMERLKQVEDALNSVYRAGAQLSQVSMTTALFGGALLGIEAAAIKSASGVDFWSKKAIAAMQATGDFMGGNVELQKRAMSELPEMIRNVAVETGQDADEVAEAFTRWQQATGAQIRSQAELWTSVQMVETIVKASAVADMDKTTAVKGVVQILGAYGMSVSDAAKVTMVLSNAAQVTNAEFGDFIESAKMGAASAARLNIPFEELIGTLGGLSAVGQRGTQAGRGLQQFLQGLIDPANEANGALQAVLVDMQGLTGSWRDIVFPGGKFIGLMDQVTESEGRQLGLIGLLANATDRLSQADREQFNAKITTQNAYRVLSPLIEAYKQGVIAASDAAVNGTKAEVMSLEDLVKTLKDTEGVQQSFKEQWDTLSTAIQIQWGQQVERLTAAFASLGTTASGALLPLIKNVADVALGMRTWATDNPALFSQLVTFGTILAGLMVVLGTFGFFLGQIIQSFTSMWIFAKAGFGAVGAAIGALGAAAFPVLAALSVAAIVLVNGWRSNFLGLRPIIEAVATALKDTLGVAILTVVNLVKVVVALFSGDWRTAWDTFQDIVVTVLALVSLYFQRFTLEVQNWGVNIVGSLAQGMLQGANAVLSGVLTAIGEIIAGFFRGMSPPKEGPLSDIDRWGENVMGAYAQGLRKGADKHIRPAAKDAAKAMSGPLEGHSPAKEGPLSQISEWGTNLMNAFLNGFKKADFNILNEMASTVSNYLKNLVENKKLSPAAFLGNMSEVRSILGGVFNTIRQGGELAANAFDRVKQIVGTIGDDLENVIRAYKDVVDQETKLDALKTEKDALKTEKEDTYGPRSDALEEERKDLEIVKYGWQEKKQSVEDAIEAMNRMRWPLEDEIEKIRVSVQSWRDKISLIEETKEPIQDVVDSIQDEVDAHREVADALREELDIVKERNDADQEGLRLKLEQANAALKAKTKEDKKEEEVLERRIAEYRARGVAPYYIQKLEDQLRKLREKHEDESEALEDAKDAAQDELDKAEKKAQAEERAIQKRLNTVDREIAADEKRLKTEQDKLKTLDRQVDLYNKEIAKEERHEKNIQKDIDVIDRGIKWAERRTKNYDDEIKAIDRREAAISQEMRLIEQQSRPLTNEIDLLDKKIKTAEAELDAAKDRLAIEQAIADYHEKVRADAESANKKDDGWKPGPPVDDENAPKPKSIQETIDEWRSKLTEATHLMSTELEAEKERIKGIFAQTGEEIKQALILPATVAGLILFRGQIAGIAGALASLATNFRLAFGPAGAALGLNVLQRLGVALQLQPLVNLGTLLANLGLTFGRFNVILGLVTSALSALSTNAFGMRDALDGVMKVIGESIGKSLGKAIEGITTAIGSLVGVFTGIEGSSQNVQVAMAFMGAAFEAFGAIVVNTVLFVTSILGGLLSGIITMVGGAVSFIINTFALIFAGIKAIFTGNGEEVSKIAQDWLKALGEFFFGGFVAIGRTVWDAFNAIADAVREWLKKIWGSGIIGDWFDSLQAAWGTFWNETIPGIFTAAGDFIKGIVEGAFNGIKGIVVGDDGKSGILGGLLTTVQNILGVNEESGLRGIFKRAMDGIKNAINAIKSPIDEVKKKLDDFITTIGNALEAAKNLPGVQGAMDLLGKVKGNAAGTDNWEGGLTWVGERGPELLNLPKGTQIFNQQQVAAMLSKFGSGMASLSAGMMNLSNAAPAATPVSIVQLHVGTLVADDRSLNELENRLKRLRDIRTARFTY